MKTEALWYLGERSIELRETELPEPGPEEVLVAVEACGICSWDIEAYAGRFGWRFAYPFSAGHEGAGKVIAVGEKVDQVEIGQRIVLFQVPVGTPGGALMARHALRKQGQFSKIPPGDTPVHHWIVEPVCCVVNGITQAAIQPGDRVAIIGTGYMGLLFVQGLHRSLAGYICAFDIDGDRLSLASHFGADRIVDSTTGVPDDLAGSFDIVIETAGKPQAVDLALKLSKRGALIETFAWHHHSYSFNLDEWHLGGWRIVNATPGMTPHFEDLYPRTIALLTRHIFSNEQLITHHVPVENAREAFDAALDKTGGYIKGVVSFEKGG